MTRKRLVVSVVCVGVAAASVGVVLTGFLSRSPKLRDTLQGHQGNVQCVCFSPDGKEKNTFGVYDGNSNLSVAFSPDGKLLAAGVAFQEGIRLWDVATGKQKSTLKGHAHSVQSVAFSPDGKLLASGSTDQTIKLWDMPGGK
jgi:WD40 repeat protein